MDEVIEVLNDINSDIDYTCEKQLVSNGLFVSFDIIQCVTGIEDKFGIEIPAEEIVAENFESAETMWELVVKLKDNID